MTVIDVMPLEQFAKQSLPIELNGSCGANRVRHKKALIAATNDIEAMECWLAEYSHRATTLRNYRKDGERLLLWAIVERRKPLSSLTGDDLLAYSNFLADPQPRERWCGPKLAKGGKRWSKQWKPFVGPLKQTARAASLRNIKSLFNYLVEVHYLENDPMIPVRRQLKQERLNDERVSKVQERIFDLEEWDVLVKIINQTSELMTEPWEQIRLRYIVALFYFAGLRDHELESHTMSAFRRLRDLRTGEDQWWLHIVGKGGRLKRIPVNDLLLAELKIYRRFLKFSELPEANETEALVRSLKTGKGITGRRVNQLLKTLSYQVAERFEVTDPEKAKRLRKLSAHWFRHQFCSIQDHIGISKRNIKDNAGHASDQTTEIYMHAFDNHRYEEMQRMPWSIKKETQE